MNYLILAGINIEEDKCLDIKIAKIYVPYHDQFLIGSILCCFIPDHSYQDVSSIKNWWSSTDIKAMLEFQGPFSLKIGISPACIFLANFPNLEVLLTYSVSNDRQPNDEFVVSSWALLLLELSFYLV